MQELLLKYYDKYFPSELIWKMGSLGDIDPIKREWNIDRNSDGRKIRPLNFKNHTEFEYFIMDPRNNYQNLPIAIHLGAVYNYEPKTQKDQIALKQANKRNKDDYLREEYTPPYSQYGVITKELVFDLDMDSYDKEHRRNCPCQGKPEVCRRCWVYIKVALEIIQYILKQKLGLRKILWVWSGRRGVHIWVLDEIFKNDTNPSNRRTIYNMISLQQPCGEEESNMKKIRLNPSTTTTTTTTTTIQMNDSTETQTPNNNLTVETRRSYKNLIAEEICEKILPKYFYKITNPNDDILSLHNILTTKQGVLTFLNLVFHSDDEYWYRHKNGIYIQAWLLARVYFHQELANDTSKQKEGQESVTESSDVDFHHLIILDPNDKHKILYRKVLQDKPTGKGNPTIFPISVIREGNDPTDLLNHEDMKLPLSFSSIITLSSKYFGEEANSFCNDVMLAFSSPILDKEVTLSFNHPLKVPFSIHSKNHAISLPLKFKTFMNSYPFENSIKLELIQNNSTENKEHFHLTILDSIKIMMKCIYQ